MRFSVVVSTYNRSASLARLLEGLVQQTHRDFEVVVVSGPSTDDTSEVLRRHQGRLRNVDCPEPNLSRSRNLGISAAAGDVIAFIDDDSVPDPFWLDELEKGYDDERVAGVGGLVYDDAGFELQNLGCICDRLSNAQWEVWPPYWAYLRVGADPFLYLPGTNCSFRRRVLADVGGFDEEIEYYLDETELCMQLIDRGCWIRPLPNAAVYHKFLASHLRNDVKVLRRPYPVLKNKCYFARRARPAEVDEQVVADDCRRFADDLLRDAQRHCANGRMTEAEFDVFQADVDRALSVGLERPMQPRRSATIQPPRADDFLLFPTNRPNGKRRVFCFASQELPPERFGGVGRYTADLAQAFVARGHEVHVLTQGVDRPRVDFEHGVWIHRLITPPPTAPSATPIVSRILRRAEAVRQELLRIAESRPIDLVSVPLWDCEGLLSQIDDQFRCILTLQTNLKTLVDMSPDLWEGPETQKILALERATVQSARFIHAISEDVLEKIRREYSLDESAEAYVLPLGIPDRAAAYSRSCDGDRVRVLFVGRLEKRKGVDVLLEAAARLLEGGAAIELLLLGDDQIVGDDGRTYRAAFEDRYVGRPWLRQVQFLGRTPDDVLYQHLVDCDVFCLPSRYESFGLVYLEAMMFSKPVIGTCAGGMTEIIEPEETGLIAEPESVESLTACLGRLVEDGDLRRRLGDAGRRRYEQEFTVERAAVRALRRYCTIIEEDEQKGLH